MKKTISTLRLLYSVPEIRKAVGFALLCIFIYKLGLAIVIPGIDASALEALKTTVSKNSFATTLDVVVGKGITNASIFALAVLTKVSSIGLIHLLSSYNSTIKKLNTEKGEVGRKQVRAIGVWLNIPISLIYAPIFLIQLIHILPEEALLYRNFGLSDTLFITYGICLLTGCNFFMVWLAGKLNSHVYFNRFFFVLVGILSVLPSALLREFNNKLQDGLVLFVLELAVLSIIIILTVAMIRAVRKIPIQYGKTTSRWNAFTPTAGTRDYIPLKVMQSSILSIQTTTFYIFVLYYITQALNLSFFEYGIYGVFCNVLLAVGAFIFSFIYRAIYTDPEALAQYLSQKKAYIPGIKPGEKTAGFIDAVVTRIVLTSSIYITFIAVLPTIIYYTFDTDMQFAQFFGGVILIFIITQILEITQRLETTLLMKRYDKLHPNKGKKGGMLSIGASM